MQSLKYLQELYVKGIIVITYSHYFIITLPLSVDCVHQNPTSILPNLSTSGLSCFCDPFLDVNSMATEKTEEREEELPMISR